MPTVVLVTTAFAAGARATARARGATSLPIVVLDADLEERTDAEVRAEWRRRVPEVLAGLARD